MSPLFLSRWRVLLAITLAAVLNLNMLPAALAKSLPDTAIVPVPKLDSGTYEWYARPGALLEVKDQVHPEIVMIGDSITHFWAAALQPSLQDAAPPAGVGAAAAEPQQVSLWSGQAPVGDGQFEAANAFITVHRPAPEAANGAAVVICPGGGYGGLVTGAEGHGIAKWLTAHGVAGIVLEYRLPQGRPFVPLLDAQRAIRTVRAQAPQWAIDPSRIGIIGFSAGGHLASTAGTHFDRGDPPAADPVNRVSCRPDFVILVYPVVTMGEKTHGGSRANLLGRDPKPDLVELFSNEKQVTGQTPPMFLAHAQDDTVVVPDNSRMLHEAIRAHQVATEYLELPSGGHGLNGYKGPMWDAWQARLLAWLAAQKLIPLRDATPPASQ